MKIKKKYSFTNKRQIFKVLPTDSGKIVIEERDIEKKQAYFNCLRIDSGKKIFKSLQLDEKFWIGIDTIHKDIIYFHKFVKPDLPQHNGIIAFDINSEKTIWEVISEGEEVISLGNREINSRAYVSRFNFLSGEQQKKVKDLEVIKEYYDYSNAKAKEALNLLSDDQIENIKMSLQKGGRKK